MANRLYPPLWVDCVCFVCRCIQFCTESVHTFHALQYIDIPRVTYIQLSHIKIVIDTQQNIFVVLVILTNWVEQKSIPKPHFCCCFFAMPISMRCTYTQYTYYITKLVWLALRDNPATSLYKYPILFSDILSDRRAFPKTDYVANDDGGFFFSYGKLLPLL